jgi:hypothetical protein
MVVVVVLLLLLLRRGSGIFSGRAPQQLHHGRAGALPHARAVARAARSDTQRRRGSTATRRSRPPLLPPCHDARASRQRRSGARAARAAVAGVRVRGHGERRAPASLR